MLQCSIKYFWIQKRGNADKEYEDAFAYKSVSNSETNRGSRVAISDGASESSFAAEWAKILTRSYRDQPFASIEEIQDRMDDLSKRWHKIVFRQPLPWFAEEKARMGAFATFLGIDFSSEQLSTGSWQAVGIGDSCLFQVRNDELTIAFPVQQSTDFGNFPDLLSSSLPRNRTMWERILFLDGKYQVGDTFILTTDALATWFLQSYEQSEHPWNEFNSFLIAEEPLIAFEEWIEKKRLSGMRNDDVTLAIIKLDQL